MGFETINGIPIGSTFDSAFSGGGAGSGEIGVKDDGNPLLQSPFDIINFSGDGVSISETSATEVEVIISGVPNVEQFYLEDLVQDSSTSDVYNQKIRLNFTPVNSNFYYLAGFCEVSMDTDQGEGFVRFRLDNNPTPIAEVSTSMFNRGGTNPQSLGIFKPMFFFARVNITATPHFLDIDWRSNTVSETTFIRQARVFALGL